MKIDANEERYDEREIYCVKKERYTVQETRYYGKNTKKRRYTVYMRDLKEYTAKI
jgi:hypothetical protein